MYFKKAEVVTAVAILSTSISLSCQLTCVPLSDLCPLIKVYQMGNPDTYINTRDTHTHIRIHIYIYPHIYAHTNSKLYDPFL